MFLCCMATAEFLKKSFTATFTKVVTGVVFIYHKIEI